MKVLWSSVAPWVPTGYGMQTSLFTPRIRDAGHDVRINAFYGLEGGIGAWEGMTVYPTDLSRLGKQMLRAYVEDFAGDDADDTVQVITLMDVWTWLDPRFGGIADFQGLRIAAWMPVDHDPAPPGVLQAIDMFGVTPIAMSKFGVRALREHGFDPLYVPHGVNTSVYQPPDNPAELKEAMGLDADTFVVGMVANNQGVAPPRKAFPQVFRAFAELHRRHPDTFLYLHTDMFGFNDGINLLNLAQFSGIPPDAFGAPPKNKYLVGGITQRQMAKIYGIMDVLANPSYGEGFGVPIIEAQACGVPVVVTDFTSMPELVGAGWKVQGDRWYDPGHLSDFMCPSVFEIVEALELAYEARGDQQLRREAREFAVGYDADTVMADYWLPALAALEGNQPVPEAKPNRAQRRAKKTPVSSG